MGRYLNPTNAMFQRSLNSQIYVDKSGLIARLNQAVLTQQCYVCVSRPRRFGKTITADMLVAYYARGSESRAQFEGLAISVDPSFEQHLNKYDVIRLNVMDFMQREPEPVGFVDLIERRVGHEVMSAHPDIEYFADDSLMDILSATYAKTQVPFVFVLDEWDCYLREHAHDDGGAKAYLDWLRALLKDKEYVALAYLTGILPIKKYGSHSALNMFTEVSMIDAFGYAEFTGFTSQEVAALCERWGMPLGETRAWYDGYSVDGVSTYNPRSVVMSMLGHKFASYWTQTETFRALKMYLDMDFDGLRESVVRLVAGERVRIDARTFQNDLTSFASASDVLTLLVHLGYLTYDPDAGEAWIPNNEVLGEFSSSVGSGGWEELARSLRESDALVEATLAGDAERVAALVAAAHADASSILRYNDENSLACALTIAYYAARRTHLAHREMPAGKGFADLVFLPRYGTGRPALVMELKAGGTPQEALAQIRARSYVQAARGHAPEAVLVGIAYDPASKEHRALIEREPLA